MQENIPSKASQTFFENCLMICYVRRNRVSKQGIRKEGEGSRIQGK